MQALRFLFSPSGRIAPQAFVVAAVVLYFAGVAAQFLTTPDVIAHSGLWPFVVAQVVLIWIWFALHAKRLYDAGQPPGLALGAALLYAIATALLLLIADSFFNTSDGLMANAGATGALGLIMLVYVITTLLGSPHFDLAWLTVAILIVVALLPIL